MPSLHLIVDCQQDHSRLLDTVRVTAENGVDWVHLRDHHASARDLYDLAQAIGNICHPRGVRFLINDRIDVALATGADAVQLGRRSLPASAARRIAPHLGIGVSTHTRDEALQAARDGADWITFGHIFATSSHPGEAPRGLDELAKVVQSVPLPVIAIGGITADNARRTIEAGAAGVAVISAILNAPDPARATRALRLELMTSPAS